MSEHKTFLLLENQHQSTTKSSQDSNWKVGVPSSVTNFVKEVL